MEIEFLKIITRALYCVLIVLIFIRWWQKKSSPRVKYLKLLIKHLRSDELKKSEGICVAFSWTAEALKEDLPTDVRAKYASEYLDLLTASCEELDVYSGNRYFPIADIYNKDVSGRDLYAHKTVKWGDSTAYSRAREAVLIRLIEKCEDLLKG